MLYMSNNIYKEKKEPITLNFLSLQNNPLITKHSKSIIEEYFHFLIQSKTILYDITKAISDNNNTELFNSYSSFFAYLIKSAFEIKCEITEAITRRAAKSFQYTKKQRNSVLIQYCAQSSDFYVILNGKVDLIAPIEHQMQLYKKDYLRYLAYLVEYEEYDIVNRVLGQNYNSFYLEIINSNKFWKLPRLNKRNSNNQIPTYISIDNLLKELSVKERNYFYIKRANHQFSSEDYLNIINNINKGVRHSEDKTISVKICLFKKIKTLTNGDCFGDNDKDNINSIYITSKATEFAYLKKDSYAFTIMPIMNLIRKDEIDYLHSFDLFKKLPYEVFKSKYANLLIKHQATKGNRLISQDDNFNYIMLLKKAEYEVTSLMSLKDIINHIMNLYENLQFEGIEKYKQQINYIVKKDYQIKKKRKKCPITNGFYSCKKNIKILSISSQEIITSNAFCSKDNIFMFNISLNSSEGEYYCIDKDNYNTIKLNENAIKEENDIISIKNTKIVLQRLIEVYELKIKYFLIHNKAIIKKVNHLSSPTPQLKTIFSVPKKQISQKSKNDSCCRSPIKLVIKPEEVELSYHEMRVILPSVDNHSRDKLTNITKETSCQTKLATTHNAISTSPYKKQDEPLSFKKLVYDGLLNNQKSYFKNNKHNITGLIDISTSTTGIEPSNEPLINTALNYYPFKKHSERLYLLNTFKEKLFISNKKTHHTSFLNYLSFKSLKPNRAINNSKSAIMKYQQSLKRSLSQTTSNMHNGISSFMVIKK